MTITWLAVPGYEGFYEVCREGLIRNVKPRKGTKAGKVLKHYNPYQRCDGYP